MRISYPDSICIPIFKFIFMYFADCHVSDGGWCKNVTCLTEGSN